MTLKLTLILFVAVLAGCTRPASVRAVASASEPVLIGIQRSGAALNRQFLLQRENLAVSTARYESVRSDLNTIVSAYQGDWIDAGQKERLERLERFRAGDAQLLSDPLATFRAPTLIVTPPASLDLKGLVAGAKALGRLKGEEGLTELDLIGFFREVGTELNKIEEEQKDE